MCSCAGTGSGPNHDPGSLDLPEAAAVVCPPAGQAKGSASIRLALPGAVEPSRAPLPATEAERHVFGSVYETLVRVDCQGRLQPALAESWTVGNGGRTWTFRLRRDARFWTGEPVTAERVAQSWRRAEALCRLRGEPSPLLDIGEFGAVGPREFSVNLPVDSAGLPLRLAHAALAVVGPSDGRGWLAGSGPCRPDGHGQGQGQGLVLSPVDGHPQQPRWESLELVAADDPRDALDTGAHALVTRSRTVRDYYAGRRTWTLLDLPWDRWYYLVTPEPNRRWDSGWDRRELAGEVGDQVATAAEFGAYQTLDNDLRGLWPSVANLSAPSLAGEDLVIWPDSDPEAGQIADRLATLAARPLRSDNTNVGRGTLAPPPTPWHPAAQVVAATDLTAHLQEAQIGAVVLPWPRRCPRPGDELTRLLSLARWLQDAAQSRETDDGAVPPGARPARFQDAAPPTAVQAAMRRLERAKVVQPLVQSRAVLATDPTVRGWSWDLLGTLQLWTMARQD